VLLQDSGGGKGTSYEGTGGRDHERHRMTGYLRRRSLHFSFGGVETFRTTIISLAGDKIGFHWEGLGEGVKIFWG